MDNPTHDSPFPFNRRRWMQRVGLGTFAGGLPGAAAFGADSAKPAAARIRSYIFVFYYGGPSHLDTFDMKPDAPKEIRGGFQPVATSVPGLQICEHLPHLAKWMHKVALVRSVHHTNRLHDSAGTELFTGRQGPKGDREEFGPIPQFFPCHGAVVHYLSRHRPRDVHHAVLPWVFHNVVDVPCQGGGFLGSSFDPFLIGGDPKTTSFRADSLKRPPELSSARIAQRRRLLDTLDTGETATATPARRLAALYDRAYGLLESKRLHEALQIDKETDATRRRYGLGGDGTRGGGNGAGKAYGRNLRGQSLLLARRLVEAGIPFVNVNDFRQQGQNWDSHADNFGQNRKHLLPPADRALAALIGDLDERGLLESTLVVAAGEFGRTPRINKNAGRDHWPDCYTVLLAGGGISGGAIYGSSDTRGAYPDRNPVTPADLAATIYARFGLSPRTEVHDKSGRPWRIAEGRPLTRLFG
ncbi:MAG: DUF1501 domain-containing protein [Planctomycetaceae bacterium]